ncbi:MAG: hypothetical protein RIB58_01820 [Phycisphaerales bacterium]
MIGLTRFVPVALAACVLCQPAPWAHAAEAGAQARPEPLEDYAAFGLSRIAMLDLRTQGEPTADDYRIADLVLDLARTYAPDEPVLLRRQIEAAWSAGDDVRAMALTRELLKLDPADEVALLRVIATGIERLQTVEERLSAYERLLNAEQLSPAVRSRLALDAALLAREAGDQERFVDLLATSTELDSTNKQSAALALAYFSAASGDAVGRLELMANLLMADPVDPNVHQQISDLLTRGGAFEQAIRFHDHARRLFAAARFNPSQEDELRRVRLRWLAQGPSGLADELELPILQERARLEQMLALLIQREEDIEGMQRPSEILPAPDSALLRMLLAEADGDPTAASRASEDLRGSTAERMRQLLLSTQGDREQARQVALLATRVRAETAVSMAIAGVQEMLVRADVADAQAAMQRVMENQEAVGQIDPQDLAPAREQLDLAVALLDTLAAVGTEDAQDRLDDLRARWQERSVPMAPLAYAHALLVHGKSSEALPLLRDIARSDPASLWGAWACQKLRDLGVGLPFPQAQALTATARAIPAWLDRLVGQPENFMELNLRTSGLEEHATGITRLTLTLRNNSPIPLAVGPNAPINSRILLSPVLDADMDRLTLVSIPEVANVDTRLRLMPRERLEIEVWAGGGLAGWYLEAAAIRTTRTRWRAIQGFIATQQAGYLPGPMCLTAETGIIVRRPLPETRLSFDAIANRLEADDPAVLPTIATALKARLIGPDTPQQGLRPDLLPIIAAIMEEAGIRFSNSSEVEQVAMLVALPNQGMARAVNMQQQVAPFDRVALDEGQQPVTLAAALLTRASDPADPAFERALQHDDPRVRELAGLMQARLEAGDRSYARFQGFGPMRGAQPQAAPAPAEGEPQTP